jgi:hypothetical protein
MDLKEIITVSGYSGLFKLIGKNKNSIIVESLVDGKRMPVFATNKASSLSEIALFTNGEEIPLKQVFQRIYKFQEKKEISIDFKTQTKEMLELFEKIIPEYDKSRVYASDIKKIFTWYNILLKNNLIDLEEEQKSENKKEEITKDSNSEVKEEEDQNKEKETPTSSEEKPTKKRTRKKTKETDK